MRMLLRACWLPAILIAFTAQAQDSKGEAVRAIVRGAGWLPGQAQGVSEAERAFRVSIEARKDAMLDARTAVRHPAMFTPEALARAATNRETTDWGHDWFATHIQRAERLAAQPEGYVEEMLAELTPIVPACPAGV